MKKHLQCSLFTLVLCGTSLLLMGAGNEMQSGPTASVVKSSITPTAPGGITGGLASKGTNSLARPTGSISGGAATGTTASVMSRATTTPVVLSSYAEELARILKFDRQVLIMVKEETHERIQRLVGFDQDGFQIIAPGIAVSVPEEKTDHVLASLRKKLIPLHYMPFVVEMNAGLRIDKIGVIKGTDQYEILRIMQTDGDEYDISNQDVIDRLKEWETISTFEIIGADADWVEIEFKTLPRDLKAFAEEVYEFSPDSVGDRPGSIEKLIKEIKATKRLFLLWE